MLTQLQQEARQYGLELHPDETKILTNLSKRRGRNARTSVDINGSPVAIIHYHQHLKYLGRKLSFDEYHKTELDNRIAAGWRKFHLLRHKLTSKHYPLTSRLRLFNSTVTPTVMYSCAAWTLNKDMAATLRRAQRRMLRLIVNTPRRTTQQTHHSDDDTNTANDATSNTSDTNLEHLITLTDDELIEPRPEFVKRATRAVEAHLDRLQIGEWTTYYFRKKWKWASRVAQQPTDRWSHLAAHWNPQLNQRRAQRPQARPRKHWDDDINSFLQHHYPRGSPVLIFTYIGYSRFYLVHTVGIRFIPVLPVSYLFISYLHIGKELFHT